MDFLWFILGVLVTILVTIIVRRIRCAYGTLTIKTSYTEKDFIHLNVDDLDQLYAKKLLVLDIIKEENASN